MERFDRLDQEEQKQPNALTQRQTGDEPALDFGGAYVKLGMNSQRKDSMDWSSEDNKSNEWVHEQLKKQEQKIPVKAKNR